MAALDDALALSQTWDVPHASAVVVTADGTAAASAGDLQRAKKYVSCSPGVRISARAVSREQNAYGPPRLL